MFTIQIKPKQIYVDETKPMADELFVTVTRFVPNTEAQFYVEFRNTVEGALTNTNLRMQGDAFNNWGNDDNYLIDWILEQVGAEKL